MKSGERNQSGRDATKIWGAALALFVVGIAVTLPFTGAPPPASIRIATGPGTGVYASTGQHVAAALAIAGIESELIETAGSSENLKLLADGNVDLAFVQGGIADASEYPQLQGLASLYFEPLWIFTRAADTVQSLADLASSTIEVGNSGSGTRAVAAKLLAANGIRATTDRPTAMRCWASSPSPDSSPHRVDRSRSR